MQVACNSLQKMGLKTWKVSFTM